MPYPELADPIKIIYDNATEINQDSIEIITGYSDPPNKHIKMPYSSQTVSFITMVDIDIGDITDDVYAANELYIYKLLHKTETTDKDVIGELVVEHFSEANDTNKLYTCFLLKDGGQTTTPSIITSIINTADTIDKNTIKRDYTKKIKFGLSSMVTDDIKGRNKKIKMYRDNNHNLVIVFLTPITISTNDATYIKTLDDITNLFALSGGPEEISIDCSPTGESDEQIKMYNIPIASDFSKEKNITDFMKTTTNFFIFLLGAVLTYFLVPHVYKKIVIDTILTTNALENVTGTPPDKQLIQRLIGADTLITVIFMMTGFSFIFSKNPTLMLIGSLLIVLYVIAYALIQSKRTDTIYMSVLDPAKAFDLDILKNFEVMQNLQFLFMNIFYLYFNFWGTVIKSLVRKPNTSIQKAAIYIVVSTGLLFMHWFLFFGDNNTPDKSSFDGKNNSKPHPDIIQNNHSLIVAYFLFVAPILTSGLDLYWS